MKNNRLGVLLIVSSLLMIALVIGLLLQRQQLAHDRQVRVQGVGVTRALAALPFNVLVPEDSKASVLRSLMVHHENESFTYGTVTGLQGQSLVEVTAPGVLVPTSPLPKGMASLFGERLVASPHESRMIREFYGPVMENGSLKAFVRVGYFESQHLLAMRDLPFFALVALAMFLLVPLIYFLVKREMAPLTDIGEQLHTLVQGQAESVTALSTSHDVRSLAMILQRYLENANARITELELDSARQFTSGRLQEYGSNKMNAVLHCLPDGLLILDPAGEVTFASSKIEPLLGVDLQHVLSQPLETWCRDPELKNLCARYRVDRVESMRQMSIEFSPSLLPGKRLFATAQPLVGGMGTMAFGTLVVIRDGSREYLAQQAGSDFVAHVSHELKSPLNVVLMYAELLQNPAGIDDAMRIDAVNIICDEAERMNLLVGNLLNVSKLETGAMKLERQRVKLDDLLRDVFDNARPRAEAKSLAMEIDIPRDMAAVMIDKDMFRIALNNLLNNAIKYSDDGGTVSLTAEEGDHDLVMRVRDTGIGISAEDQLHVFEKFYRASNGETAMRSGHGLGLYLTSQIIELHHGRLSLTSEPGRGSEFAVHLKKIPLLVEGTNVL